MNSRSNDNPSDIPAKAQRQREWLADCRARGLSVEEMNRAASIIPEDAVIRVLEWPKL